MSDEQLDCVIVGGGPAGLTAAIYLARFHLSTAVFDDGNSRALQIPCTHNQAAFPEGIAGEQLLARMREHAARFRVRHVGERVHRLASCDGGFQVTAESVVLRARAVLLATGVTNRRPEMHDTLHGEALRRGRLRYCPVCDGYEVTDRDVAVIGTGARSAREAEFLRAYTDRVTLVVQGPEPPEPSDAERLEAIGVRVVEGPAEDFRLEQEGLSFAAGGRRLCFEAVYPALGSSVHSGLATALGAEVTDEGCIKVDSHQRTSVAGLYAAGDVVIGLDQISHAMGEAGVAATTMRNDLAALSPKFRSRP